MAESQTKARGGGNGRRKARTAPLIRAGQRPQTVVARTGGNEDAYGTLKSFAAKPVTSLSYFIEVMSGLKGTGRLTGGGGLSWFRGQPSVAYHLTPGALREAENRKRIARLERLGEFIRRATYRVPSPPPQDDVLHWMQIAQHYGLPTRLLDWTLNPAVALYFACSGGGADDAAVFMLRPDVLNRPHIGGEGRVLDMSLDGPRLTACARDNAQFDKDQGTPIYAVQLVITFERVYAQRGAFTLHGSKFERLDDADGSTLQRVTVDGPSKPKILRELANIGIDRASLFPELEQLSRHLKELDDAAEGSDA